MRAVSQMNKSERNKRIKHNDVRGDSSGKATYKQYAQAKRQKIFCYDLTRYYTHVQSITNHESKAKCTVCILDTWKKVNGIHSSVAF